MTSAGISPVFQRSKRISHLETFLIVAPRKTSFLVESYTSGVLPFVSVFCAVTQHFEIWGGTPFFVCEKLSQSKALEL